MAATAQQTMQAINATCRARGGVYADYSCQVVSWDDASRGAVGVSISCWGANITDTYLRSKDRQELFTVRSDNWNEKLGRISSGEIALVAQAREPGGTGPLRPVTLRRLLGSFGEFGGYAGIERPCDLSNETLDSECSIRFQTTFLPVAGGRGALEFGTEAYNYNTTDDADPRNLVLLCTAQGVAVQQDGAGAKRLLHHAVGPDGSIHRHWLEAERSDHRVGGPQRETASERGSALARGKATASVIGTEAMGMRFNVLMTIQVPLLQQSRPERHWLVEAWVGVSLSANGLPKQTSALDSEASDVTSEEEAYEMLCSEGYAFRGPSETLRGTACVLRGSSATKPRLCTGIANAARVSRGTEYDIWPGLSLSTPRRNPTEHVTVTVVIYHTVANGVPGEDDVVAAIDDLEALYKACGAQGRLAEQTFDFMKTKLTTESTKDICTKVTLQPYQPPPEAVQDFGVFPA